MECSLTPTGKIIGWLSLAPIRQAEEGEILVHPDHPELLAPLLEQALARSATQRWLLPDYQAPVGDLLRYRGLHEVSRYTMLVKTVAARVASRRMVAVEA